MTDRPATPLVRRYAAAHSIDLDAVAATGVGGRITLGDVRHATGRPRVAATAPHRTVMAVARCSTSASPQLAAEMKRDPARVQQAAARSPAPPLFVSGTDVPVFTASGLDPAMLRHLPWRARPAIARAPTVTAAAALMAPYVELTDEEGDLLAEMEHGSDPTVVAYEQRLAAWLGAGPSDADLYTGLFPT